MKKVKIWRLWYIIIMLLSSCSFKSKEDLTDYNPPKLIFNNMTIVTFENLNKSSVFEVKYLENYLTDKMWAGKDLYFIQYDTDKKNSITNESPIRIKGKLGTALFDKQNKEFFFGDSVFLEITENDLTISAPMLFFEQEKHILHAPIDATVNIKKGYDLELSGKGFIANTLSKEFKFKEVKGIVSEKVETKNDSK